MNSLIWEFVFSFEHSPHTRQNPKGPLKLRNSTRRSLWVELLPGEAPGMRSGTAELSENHGCHTPNGVQAETAHRAVGSRYAHSVHDGVIRHAPRRGQGYESLAAGHVASSTTEQAVCLVAYAHACCCHDYLNINRMMRLVYT